MADRSWTDRNENDPGILLVELLAYLADALSAYQDQLAAEARLKTRRRYALALAALAFAFACRRRRGGAEAPPRDSD